MSILRHCLVLTIMKNSLFSGFGPFEVSYGILEAQWLECWYCNTKDEGLIPRTAHVFILDNILEQDPYLKYVSLHLELYRYLALILIFLCYITAPAQCPRVINLYFEYDKVLYKMIPLLIALLFLQKVADTQPSHMATVAAAHSN